MDNYPDDFTFVQIHIGDAYATTWGNARKAFYGVTGTPTAWFDGVLQCVGAYPSVGQQYGWYLGKFNGRNAYPTDIVMELSGEYVSGTTYRVVVNVMREPGADTNPKSMRIYTVQVLDYWPAAGGYHRNGFKQAASNQDVSLLPGESVRFERTFTLDSDSNNNKEDVKIIAWAQQPNTSSPAEVYQTAQMTWPFPQECRQGRVDVAVSGPAATPVLFVNSEAGRPSTRTVQVGQNDPFELYMDAPPSGPGTAPFALYVWLGEPTESSVTPHPQGVGDMCFATPLIPGSPSIMPRKVWNNIGKPQLLGEPDFPSSPAPSVVLSRPAGLGVAVTATFQGLIVDDGSAADKPGSVTNAVIVNSQ
jgi:hypothetical protein